MRRAIQGCGALFIVALVLMLAPQSASAQSIQDRINDRLGSLQERLDARQQLLQERLKMQQDRLCDRLGLINERVGYGGKPAFCEDGGGNEPDKLTLDFSANPQTIDEGESSTLSWNSDNADECTATGGWSGDKDVDGEEEVTPTEDTTYTLTCEGEGGSVEKSVTVEVNEDEPEPDEPTLEFSADPQAIDEGDSSELSWNSENADSCTASNGWSGDKAVDGEEVVSPTATTTYTLECTGDGGSVTKSVTVGVDEDEPQPDEPTLTLSADPLLLTEVGTSTLSWDSDNADSCTASNGWSGDKAVDGEEDVFVSTTTTYSLECVGDGGSVMKSVTVEVEEEQEVPTLTFTATPDAITEGATSTLAWDSDGADSCVARGGWSGDKSLDGEEVVSPTATTTYTLDCGNEAGTTTESVTVGVSAVEEEPEPETPTVSLLASPEEIEIGATSTLSWTTTDADSCVASGDAEFDGSVATSGEEIVSPATTTEYMIVCSGDGGMATDTAMVIVTEAEPEAPTLTFTADLLEIEEGATSTLSWESEDADLCIATGGWSGEKSLDGEEVVSPTATTTYTLDCGNEAGTTTESVTISVTPVEEPEPDAPTVSLLADPMEITEGATSTLSWSSTNANACTASGSVVFSGTVATSGEQVVSPATTTEYMLVCEGAGGMATDTATIIVNEDEPEPVVPTLSFTATPDAITEGATSTLAWDSDGADSCVASNGWSGDKSLDGEEVVSPTATTTYTLDCVNEVGTTTESVTVGVSAVEEEPVAPTLTFSASPMEIEAGATSTLVWTTENADSCVASNGWSGDKAVNGEQLVELFETTLYTLSCENEVGTTTESVTVTVLDEEPGEINLLISEVYYDVADDKGEENSNEWVEIYNAGTTTVNLMGYSLGASTSSVDVISDTELLLDAGGLLIVAADSGATSTSEFWDFTERLVVSLGSPITASGLANGGDTVILYNAELEAQDAVSYGSSELAFSPSVPGVSEGHSIARNPIDVDTDTAADWSDESTPTPGADVFEKPLADADGILITEVYFDVDDAHGSEGGNEWIELYNAGTTTIDLMGWSVGDESTNVDVIATTTLLLEPGAYIIVAADTGATTTDTFWDFSAAMHMISLGSSISGGLANGGDSVRLFDDSLAEIDAVGYGNDTEVFASGAPDAAEGNSVSRDPRDNDTDLGSDWIEETTPNPGN